MFVFGVWDVFGGMLGDIFGGAWGCFAGMFVVFCRDLGGNNGLTK